MVKLKVLEIVRLLKQSVAFVIYLSGAHHIDLRASSSEDPDWLLEQRAIEIKVIESWIHNYYQEKKAISNM